MRLFSESPNDSPQDGTIHEIALAQLREWESVARTWRTYTDGRGNRCQECHQNLWFTKDASGREYRYEDGHIMALIVAHLRQVHTKAVAALKNADRTVFGPDPYERS